VAGWVAASEEPVLNASAALDLARRLRPAERLELNATLAVPLASGGRGIGVLAAYHTSYNFYQPHHLRLLTLIAEHAGPALARSLAGAATPPLSAGRSLAAQPHDLLPLLGAR
jgi:GAF domain-containing protein